MTIVTVCVSMGAMLPIVTEVIACLNGLFGDKNTRDLLLLVDPAYNDGFTAEFGRSPNQQDQNISRTPGSQQSFKPSKSWGIGTVCLENAMLMQVQHSQRSHHVLA